MRKSNRLIFLAMILLLALVSLSAILFRPQPFHSLVEEPKPHSPKNRIRKKARDSLDNATHGDLSKHPDTNNHRGKKPHKSAAPTAGQTVNNRLEHAATFDDIFATTLDPKVFTYESSNVSLGSALEQAANWTRFICDDVRVPFVNLNDERCTSFLVDVTSRVSSMHQQASNNVAINISDTDFFRSNAHAVSVFNDVAVVNIEPMQQKFEQRTIKFKLTMHFEAKNSQTDRSANIAAGLFISWILKVPQVLFPIEPFAEVAAFHFDRRLVINRVPPSALVPLSIVWVRNISTMRTEKTMHMVKEFLAASSVTSYDEWIEKDFVQFLRTESSGKYVDKNKNALCSVQLFMREVMPILGSSLTVPYSKQNPGWHRWFDVNFAEYPVAIGPLLALSELSVFDFIIRNNDRSPNKNNFIVGTCKKCVPRRPSGTVPTLVHLDHGMSFYGPGSHTVHNPLSKSKEKLKFCIFYRPQVEQLRKLQAAFDGTASSADGVATQWQRYLMQGLSALVLRAIGESKLLDCGSQVVKVLKRVETCIELFNESAVLRP